MRHFSRLLLVLIITVCVGGIARPAQAAMDDTRVLPQLQKEAEANPNRTIRVIVTRVQGNRGADRAMEAQGGDKVKDLSIDAYVANLSGKAVLALGKNPAVKFVSYDAPMLSTKVIDGSKLGTVYPGTIIAPQIWSGSTSSYTGAGIGVAVLDSGITDSNRADWLNSKGSSRIVAKAKFSSATGNTNDSYGHGTHVAGIIAGNSWYNSNTAVQGKYIGIAPEANLINVKVSDDHGISYVSDVVDAIEWTIANRVKYNIRVMNLSLVSSVAESAATSTLAAAVERAWFNGIFVSVAAGNSGPDTMQYPPANDPFVVTVGAADPMGTVDRSDDGMAPWSSYGITQDGYSKPDVVAPGRYIIAPLASSSSTFGKQFPDRIVDGEYIWMSGTSMAAPVVAGLAALMFQAHPNWTNDQVKWLLMNSATKLGTTTTTTTTTTTKKGSTSTTQTTFTPLPSQGAGLINPAGMEDVDKPGYANQGLTINEQLVTADRSTNYASANWTTANWSTTNWSTANWSTANWSTANWSTANWTSAPE